jgi:hypothetical protein
MMSDRNFFLQKYMIGAFIIHSDKFFSEIGAFIIHSENGLGRSMLTGHDSPRRRSG